jgi:hypothetical protein
MFSQPIQTLLVQARVEELHRVARTSNRAGAIAAYGSGANRRVAPVSTLVKRALSRVFDVGRAGSDEVAAIPSVQLVGHPSTTSSSHRS